MRSLIALFCGALFGAGLHVSGMTDTVRVQSFLDFYGAWDPTLLFVMGGALIPMGVAWRLTPGRRPLTGRSFPTFTHGVDRQLVIGAVLFGIGWGLAGLCPGPALASLAYGGKQGLLFLAAMIAGMRLAPFAKRHLDSPATNA